MKRPLFYRLGGSLLLSGSLFLLTLVVSGCRSRVSVTSINDTSISGPKVRATAPVLVYKTKAAYDSLVPVLMNTTKTSILAYPGPSDLFPDGKPSLPVPLRDGYLLDRRGIGPDVAFLRYSYGAYGALKQVPALNQLMDSILDNDPLVELWDCSARVTSQASSETLDSLIQTGFAGCRRLK